MANRGEADGEGEGARLLRKRRIELTPALRRDQGDSIDVGDEIWSSCKESGLLAARYKIALPR
jgi:hypothetical protein